MFYTRINKVTECLKSIQDDNGFVIVVHELHDSRRRPYVMRLVMNLKGFNRRKACSAAGLTSTVPPYSLPQTIVSQMNAGRKHGHK